MPIPSLKRTLLLFVFLGLVLAQDCGQAIEQGGCKTKSGTKSVASVPTTTLAKSSVLLSSTTTITSTPSTTVTAKTVTKTKFSTVTETADEVVETAYEGDVTTTTTKTQILTCYWQPGKMTTPKCITKTKPAKRATTLEKRATKYPTAVTCSATQTSMSCKTVNKIAKKTVTITAGAASTIFTTSVKTMTITPTSTTTEQSNHTVTTTYTDEYDYSLPPPESTA